jgi:hypothetical protein
MKQPKNKPPVRRVACDSYEVTIGGVTYYPHEGEWAEFRGGPSWQFLRDSAALASVRGSAVKDTDQTDLIATIDRLMEFLASRLVAWNWTDDSGKPLPPPSVDVLQRIDQDEAQYLMGLLSSSFADKDAEKNA